MSITTTTRSAGPFLGSGAAVVAPFTFKVFSAADLLVTRTVAGVDTELVLNADYTVALNADQDSTPGGSITTTIPVGAVVNINSQVEDTQLVVLPNGGPWFPKVVENALDRLTAVAQQLRSLFGRAVRVPEAAGTAVLPNAASRANNLLGFDSNGNPIAVAPVTGSAASLAADLANSALVGKGAGQVGHNPLLAYAASTVGFALNARKAVFGTGVAATDDANLQAAIDAAVAGTVIDLFGTFASSAAKNLKPQLMLRNGNAARINHSNTSTNCFQYVPGGGLGFPGQIKVLGLQIYGPGEPGSGEALGTLTWGTVKAAVFIDANAPNCEVDCDIRSFFAGVVLRNAYCSTVGGQVFDCRHGIMIFGESHNTQLANPFVENCTLTGLSVNYGGGQTTNQGTFTVEGAYQNTQVGIWLEGCQGFYGAGTIYFEGNTNADIVNGVADGGAYARSANFTKIDSIGSSSPVGSAQVAPLKVAAQGRNIQVYHSVDVRIGGIGMYSGAPTATAHVHVDGFSDRTFLGVSFFTSSNPYDLDDAARVITERAGATNFARNRTTGLTYGTHGSATPAGRGPWFGGGFSGRDSIILEALTANTDLLFRAATGTGQVRFADAAMTEVFSVDFVNMRINCYRPLVTRVYTVATLPAPSGTVPPGSRATVSDANSTTFNAIVAGGGANTVPVFVDGASNWRIG